MFGVVRRAALPHQRYNNLTLNPNENLRRKDFKIAVSTDTLHANMTKHEMFLQGKIGNITT